MAVIQNIINTVFNTSGAGPTADAADRVGRAQTRMGQSSVAAGRGFAAQSQGLGGLVGAYAGAAATTFALSAAFDALARSARAAQTLEGLTSLAADSALAGQELLTSVKEITKGQLSLVEAAEQINLSLSAGFDTSQIEGLAGVASKASRALGRDLADSFTRVVRGSAKLETELLDELGIYTKIEPATKAYAAAIGTTANKLTEFQRRQAFVNSVIAEGERKFSSINTTIPTSAEKIEAFAKTISDLISKIGIFIADSVAPLAEFLTKNLAGSLAVLGIAGSLVFAKLFSELGNFADGIQKRSSEIRNNIQNNIIDKFGRAAQAARDSAQQTAKSLDLRPDALSRSSRSELSILRNTANQRALNNDELRRGNAILQQRAALLANKRTALAQEILAQRAVARSTASSTAERNAANAALATARTRLERLQSVTRANTASINALTAATTSASLGFARLAAGALTGFLAIGAGLAKLVTGFITLSSVLIGLVAVGGLLTAAIFSATGRTEELNAFLKQTGQFLKSFSGQADRIKNRKVFQGLVGGALEDMEKTNSELREIDSFTFKKKVFTVDVEIVKTKEQIVSDVSKLLTEISTGTLLTEGERVGTVIGGAIKGGIVGGIAGSFAGLPTALGGAFLGSIAGGAQAIIATAGRVAVSSSDAAYTSVLIKFQEALAGITDEATNKNITQALAQYEKQYGQLAKSNPEVRALLDTLQALVLASAKFADNVSEVSTIIKATGDSSAAIAKNYSDFDNSIAGISKAVTNIGGINIPIAIITDDVEKQIEIFGIDVTQKLSQAIANTAYRNNLSGLVDLADAVVNKAEDISEIQIAAAMGINESEFNSIVSILDRMGLSLQTLSTYGAVIFSGVPEAAQKATNAIAINNKVLRELTSGVSSGRLSFEQFEQLLGSAGSGVDTLTLRVRDLRAAYEAAQSDTGNVSNTLVVAIGESLRVAEAALSAQQGILEVAKAQTAEFQAQADIMSFIKGIKTSEMSTLDFELALNTAGTENKVLTTLTYLNTILEQSADQVKAYKEAVTAASNLPDPSIALSNPLVTAEDAENLARILNDTEKVTAKAVDTTVIYTNKLKNVGGTLANLTNESIAANIASEDLKTAMQSLAKEGLLEVVTAARKQIAELDNLVKANTDAIAKINAEKAEIEFKATIDRQSLARELDIIKQEGVLDALELQVELTKAKEKAKTITPEESANTVNALQLQILEERKRLLTIETDNQLAAIDAKQSVAEFEAQVAKDTAKNKADALRAEVEAKEQELNALADIYSSFLDGQQKSNQQLQQAFVTGANAASKAIAETFQRATLAISTAIVSGLKGAATTQVVAPGKAIATDLETFEFSFDNVKLDLRAATDAAVESITALETAEVELANTRLEESKRTLDAERTNVVETANIRLAGLETQAEIEAENAKSRIADAKKAGKKGKKGKDEKTEAELLGERTRDTLLALFDGIQGALNTAITDFGNLILYGEGNIGDIFSNLFKSIQQTVFQETIAKPFSNFLTESLFQQTRRGIENAKVDANGALLVKVSGGIDALVSGPLKGQEPSKETGKTFLDGLTKEGGFFDGIKNFFGSLFSKDGFFGQIFSTIGSLFSGGGAGGGGILSSLFSGIATLFSASGGSVHRAGGGAIPSVMARDRVNAMLEPGEFVIRKPMARQIGTPALQQMNATGKGAGGDVQVNINNQGTPQQAQASSPRFDGEKYVIDIITRDLSNNGPIRRSLRGDR